MNDPLIQLVITQTWQITVLAIVIAIVVKLAARNRPHLAHALWLLVLIKCVTPPLWGHSLGLFSQLQTLAVPPGVTSKTEDADYLAEVAELSGPQDSFEMPFPPDAKAVIAMGGSNNELRLIAEAQRREAGEETQSDPASLRHNVSESEIPVLHTEPETHAAKQPSTSVNNKLPILLFGGLIIGAIVTLMTMVIRCLRCLRQIRLHRTTEFDEVLCDRIERIARQLRICRIPRIIVSDVLFGPAVLGFFRHTIVLPRCLFEEGIRRAERRESPDECSSPTMQRNKSEDLRPAARKEFLDPILAHELLHIRRGDLRTGTLQAIVQCLWWFHPAVWFCNRWLSREAERCCDEQVIAELGCSPAQYARSLLSVIECKHQLQPIPVFPGMKPVEITTQRMERIMSLKNGLKKRTPLWCWLMIMALAFVVLPGAVATPSVDENPPVMTTSSDDAESVEIVVAPTIRASYSRKNYDVSDLLTRLSDEQGIPAAVANRQLHRVLETSVWGLYDFSEKPADAPPREMYIHLYGDQLVVSNSDEVHAKISEELSRFRKLGCRRFQVTARFIAGSVEEINEVMSSLKIEAPFAETKDTQVVENNQTDADRAKLDLHSAITYRMGSIGFVSRNQARAIEEVSRARPHSLIVKSPNAQQAFNGQTATIGVGETKADIVARDETPEPTIGTMLERLTVHLTPAFVDDGVVRLQCVSSFEGITEMPPVSTIKTDSESSERLREPKTPSKRVQTTVELRNDRTFFLTGIATSQDGKRQAVLVILDAIPVSMKPLTSLIRLDESFIPSPEMVLTSNTVVAYVADKKITVADFAIGIFSQLDKDTKLSPEQRQQILLEIVTQRLPGYLYDEVALHEFHRTLPSDKEAEVRKSLEPAFSAILKTMAKDMRASNTDELEHMLQAQGFSIEGMRESFIRRQFVVGHSQSLPVGSPIQNQAAIEAYCRQLLFEARLRQKISVKAEQSFSPTDLLNLGKEYGVSISRIGISDDDLQATLATDIVDQPLLDAIKAIVESHGFQVAVGQEEVVLTAKPKDESQPAKKEQEAVSRLVLCAYPVADLVVPLPNVDAQVGGPVETNVESSRSIEFATAVQPSPDSDRLDTLLEVNPTSEENRTRIKADFAPLMELIKATVEPDSWHKEGAVVMEVEDTLSLVIRQTDEAHGKIFDLLSQLRNAQDQNVQVKAQLLKLTDEGQTKWVDDNCSLHPLQNGNRWALLSPQRSVSFTQSLTKLNPEVLSCPSIFTVSGQTATIHVGGITEGEDVSTGFRLELTPHLLPDSEIIRLQHSFSIGAFDVDMPRPIESLVGSGQTLVLLFGGGAGTEPSETAMTQYLLLLTPEHVPMAEDGLNKE